MTIYRERANGRWEFWTYSDGRRVYVSHAWAISQVAKQRARLVLVS